MESIAHYPQAKKSHWVNERSIRWKDYDRICKA